MILKILVNVMMSVQPMEIAVVIMKNYVMDLQQVVVMMKVEILVKVQT